MWKKYLFFACIILTFVTNVENVVAKNCVCEYVIMKPDLTCNIKKELVIELGEFNNQQSSLMLSPLLERDARECPGFVQPTFEVEEPIIITAENCRGLRVDGDSPQGTFGFVFQCKGEQDTQINQNNQNPTGPSNKSNATVRLVNPIGGTEENPQGTFDMRIILGRAVQVVMGLLGSITLGVLFYGGFLWLTSAGNSDKVSKGSKTMLYAVIGLFIIFGSYGILSTIIQGVRSGFTDTNEVPFGPENDTFRCESFSDETNCEKSNNSCAWTQFEMPGSGEVNACVPKDQVVATCRNFYTVCLAENGDSDDSTTNELENLCFEASVRCPITN